MPPRQSPFHARRTRRAARLGAALAVAAMVAACGPNYSPNTYSGTAVQQANKVEQGIVIGVREVAVSVSGGVGAISGATAGGITGAQVGTGAISALSALGGTLLGGVVGATAEKVAADTRAFEYIVRKPNAELVSVTQKDDKPLEIGARVLVIAGAQARIVPDYTVHQEVAAAPSGRPAEATPNGQAKPADTANPGTTAEAGTTAGTPPPSAAQTEATPPAQAVTPVPDATRPAP